MILVMPITLTGLVLSAIVYFSLSWKENHDIRCELDAEDKIPKKGNLFERMIDGLLNAGDKCDWL